MQVVPQILHVLQVDQYASTVPSGAAVNTSGIFDDRASGVGFGGMDFGNLCLYVCADFDNGTCMDDGIVVVQAPVDDLGVTASASLQTSIPTTLRQQYRNYGSQPPCYDQENDLCYQPRNTLDDGAVYNNDNYDDDDEGWEPDN